MWVCATSTAWSSPFDSTASARSALKRSDRDSNWQIGRQLARRPANLSFSLRSLSVLCVSAGTVLRGRIHRRDAENAGRIKRHISWKELPLTSAATDNTVGLAPVVDVYTMFILARLRRLAPERRMDSQ